LKYCREIDKTVALFGCDNGVPWKQIKGMRNVIVHHYGNVDIEELWHTITEDIPSLRQYCEGISCA